MQQRCEKAPLAKWSASPSPLSRAQDAAAVPEEDVDSEDADARSEAPAQPPLTLSPDGRCRRFSLALLSTV